MLLRRPRRGDEQHVAAWAVAGQPPDYFWHFVWALALAGRGERGGRIGGRWWIALGRWLLGRSLGWWWRRHGASRVLLPTAAIASGLFAAAFFAVVGGPVALTGMPVSPVSGGVLAGRATVLSLGPLG